MARALEVATARWAAQLAAWAIPDAILAAAPESPWGFPPALFQRTAANALASAHATPSRRRALEVLAVGGSVLDVGAGAGAASLPLVPPAGSVVAVDEGQAMLDAFAGNASTRGAGHREVLGRWPDVAVDVGPADVVMCHHVVYNVSDLAPFLTALDSHARRRVVIELTARHPQSDLNPLWKSIHGLDRPTGPVADDATSVASALGFYVRIERSEQPSLWHEAHMSERVAFARRRLCVGPEFDSRIADFLESSGSDDRELVTIWWDPQPQYP